MGPRMKQPINLVCKSSPGTVPLGSNDKRTSSHFRPSSLQYVDSLVSEDEYRASCSIDSLYFVNYLAPSLASLRLLQLKQSKVAFAADGIKNSTLAPSFLCWEEAGILWIVRG